MAKDSKDSRIAAGELLKKVEFQGQKTLKKYQTAPTSLHVVWEGFNKKNNANKLFCFHQKQSPAYSVVRQDWNLKWDWLLWSDETKMSFSKANELFSNKHSRWVW